MYNKQDVIDLLGLMGINFTEYNQKVLEDIIGEEINYEALALLIIREKKTWMNLIQREMSPSYCFGTLKNIVKYKYRGIKHGLDLLAD